MDDLNLLAKAESFMVWDNYLYYTIIKEHSPLGPAVLPILMHYTKQLWTSSRGSSSKMA
jgi:hypothetical protein